MAAKKKLQVFISSTFSDLRNERQAAVEAILTAGHIPAGMELFTAGDESQMNVIKRWIDESDIYLLILGGRYGSIEPTSRKSYTHLEYEYAVEKGKPLFGVVITDEHLNEKVKQFGLEVTEKNLPQELQAFREIVCSKMVKFWSDPRDIKLAILETLKEFSDRENLTGWVRGDEVDNTIVLAEEMARLTKEKERLAKENSNFRTGPIPSIVPESVLPMLHVDVLELNFGHGLLSLVDQTTPSDLLECIIVIRQKIALELGLIIPVVRVRDDLHLRATDYAVKLKGATVAAGAVQPNSIMLIDPGSVIDPITDGIPTKEPAFGVPALWVSKSQRKRAEKAGYTVVDPSSVITTHLAEVIKGHAAEILTRQDTQALIDHIKQGNSVVVEELTPNLMTIGEVQRVLQHLLRERISIRDLVTILETLADHAGRTKDVDMLGEWVRSALARSICRQYVDDGSGALQTLTIDPSLEQQLLEAVTPGLPNLALEPSASRLLIHNLSQQMERMIAMGYHQPVLLCMSALRLPLRRLTERSLPNLVILSYNEIVPNTEVRAVGAIDADFLST